MGFAASKESEVSQSVTPSSKVLRELPQEQPIAANPTNEFKVLLERSSDGEKLGMRLVAQKTHLLVRGFKEVGLVLDWNAKQVGNPELQIRPGDIITAVNDVAINADDMVKLFDQKVVCLTVLHSGGTVFVKDLDENIDDQAFCEMIGCALEKCGLHRVMLSSKLASGNNPDNDCRGYGFVYFKTEEDARLAAEHLNSEEVGGNKLQAMVAHDLTMIDRDQAVELSVSGNVKVDTSEKDNTEAQCFGVVEAEDQVDLVKERAAQMGDGGIWNRCGCWAPSCYV